MKKRILYIGFVAVVFFGSVTFANSVETVLAGIREANGGKEAMEKVKSFVTTGEIENGEYDLKFTLVKKRPNLFRMEVVRPDGSLLISGFDGKEYWQVVQFKEFVEDIELTEGIERSLENYTDFDGRLISLNEDYPEFEYRGLERLDRVDCHVLGLTDGGFEYLFYIDSRSFRDVKTIQQELGGERREESFYLDHRKVGPFWLSHIIKTERSDGTIQTVQVESVELSVGIFDLIFEKPKENLPEIAYQPSENP